MPNLLIKKYYLPLIIGCTVLISFFLQMYHWQDVPPCINADEAAFGYNAYSILKTGKDEHGLFLPLRLTSFGDYKMPLYSYASLPFIAIFGLNELSTRMLNIILATLMPIVIFFLIKELFGIQKLAIIGSLLTAVSLGLHLISRQAHEAYLSIFLVSLALLFFLRLVKKDNLSSKILFLISITLTLFSYQSGRLYGLLFFVIYYLLTFTKKIKFAAVFFSIFIVLMGLFILSDIKYKPARVSSLFLTSNIGFQSQLTELKTQGGIRYLYNPLVQGFKDVLYKHLNHYSSQFLISNGDQNLRFGFPGMSVITPLEYLLFFIGLYFLFKNKEQWRYLLLVLLIATPLTSSLSWAEESLTRSLFLLILIVIIASYGTYHLVSSLPPRSKTITGIGLSAFLFLFLIISWDFYFSHYPKEATVIRSWQCGYQQLADYIKNNYNQFNTFYITKKNGQPYIFLLFYLNYPPNKYQNNAQISPPNESGFTQVEKFDKFRFEFKSDAPPKTVAIGYPDDFNDFKDKSKLKKIIVGTEEMFDIYENP